MRVALIVVLGVLAVGALAEAVTSSPRVCGSCHEMAPRTTAWKASPHAEVECVKCHQPPTKWYEVPQALASRTRRLGKDISAHSSGRYEDPVETRPAGIAPMADEVCLQCHDPNRKATSGFRILIDHPEHAKRNGSCVSCHVRTAHPLPTRGTPLSLMTQCYTCHGTAKYPKASTECRVCHPTDFDLKPESHETVKWKPSHGKVALSDAKQCTMCHKENFCTNCHGLKMPHPNDWTKGKSGHATLAQSSRTVCTKCHEDKPDLCSMCHHKDFIDPMKGPWVKQHFDEARKKGTEYCMKCHAPVYCTQCHVKWASQGS